MKWNVTTLIRRGSNLSFFATFYCSCFGLNASLPSRQKGHLIQEGSIDICHGKVGLCMRLGLFALQWTIDLLTILPLPLDPFYFLPYRSHRGGLSLYTLYTPLQEAQCSPTLQPETPTFHRWLLYYIIYLTATNFGFDLKGVGLTCEKIALGTCRRIVFSVFGSIGNDARRGSAKDHSDNLLFSLDDIPLLLSAL